MNGGPRIARNAPDFKVMEGIVFYFIYFVFLERLLHFAVSISHYMSGNIIAATEW